MLCSRVRYFGRDFFIFGVSNSAMGFSSRSFCCVVKNLKNARTAATFLARVEGELSRSFLQYDKKEYASFKEISLKKSIPKPEISTFSKFSNSFLSSTRPFSIATYRTNVLKSKAYSATVVADL